MNKQYSLNEICILPSSKPTDIYSRSQVNPFDENGNLPIFVAPMTSVIDETNYQKFIDNKVIPILPRNCMDTRYEHNIWHSYSLQEFETIVESSKDYNDYHILIDIANGHIQKLYDLCIEAKKKWPNIILMVGNIAHPDLYLTCCKAGIDYVRVGIGGGTVCSTSVQTAIHASHFWMIDEIKYIKSQMTWSESNPDYNDPKSGYWESEESFNKTVERFNCNGFRTKIIADGGINTLDKIIKCLALGYDYVMVGRLFAQCEEACGLVKTLYTYKDGMSTGRLQTLRKYYGMASEQGQIDISGGCTKNPEGIETWVEVNTNLLQFTTKIEAALRSTMSYVGAHNLEELKHNTNYGLMSIEEFKSYYK